MLFFLLQDVPGRVVDVSCLNVRDQNRHGPYRVCILHAPSDKPLHGSKLTLFELSKEMVPGTFTIWRKEREREGIPSEGRREDPLGNG